MEFLVEIVIEIILQIALELGFEFTFRNSKLSPAKIDSKLFSLFSYAFLGFGIGCITLVFHREHFITNLTLRKINLLITPLILGYIMSYRGKVIRKRGDETIRLETFGYGFLFAFGLGLARYLWGK
ncbi:MAG: hypothetical protein V4598_07555 [Bdellovibrionota bacterium]